MRSVCSLLIAGAMAVLPAAAQTHDLRIQEMSLAEAINRLAEQTGTVIISEGTDLTGITSPALSGEMSVSQALQILLANSSLISRSDMSGVWIIRREAAPEAPRGKPRSMTPPVVKPQPVVLPDMDTPRTYDTVIVTGSRSSLTEWESMSPVEVLTQTDLAAPVSDDFGDVLAELLPGFFVQRRPLSDGAVFVRPYSLRNLSADHTLIMVNGKRQHRSAMLNTGGSQSSDLSRIPTNAIQRVEVLRDGASAQYGSDAIAGVINVITRDDPEIEATAQYSQYYEGDGIQKRLGFGGGARGPQGGLRLDFDYSDAAPTSRARQRLDALEYLQKNPDADIEDPVQKWGQPEREDIRILLTGDHEAPLGRVYGFVNASQGQGVTDFNWRSPATPSVYTISPVFDGWDLRDVYPNGFKPEFGQEEKDVSATFGIKGGPGEGVSYDFSASFGGNRIDYFLYDTVNASMGPDSPTYFDAGGLRQQEYNLNTDFKSDVFVPFVSRNPVNLAFGLEAREERYGIIAGDAASYAIGPGAVDGLTSGSNGFPGYTEAQAKTHDQVSWAAYADAEAAPTESSRLGFALRYEEFDTFGGRLSGKFSFRHDIGSSLMMRGTVSTGFKAPTPAQMFSERTSQGVAPDTLDVFTNGRFSPAGPVAKIISERSDTYISPLRPETSVNFSAGLVFRPSDNLVGSIDVYNIEVSDRIFVSDGYTLGAEERMRLASLGVPGGESITTVSFYQNSFDTRTSGLDLLMKYNRSLAAGDFSLSVSYNYNRSDVVHADFIDNPSRIARFERLYPRYSANSSASYRYGNIALQAKLRWIGPWADYTDQDGTYVQEFGAELFVDAGISWDVNTQMTLSLGAENLFNQYPDEAMLEASKGLIYSRNAPYDTDGGLYYIRLTARL